MEKSSNKSHAYHVTDVNGKRNTLTFSDDDVSVYDKICENNDFHCKDCSQEMDDGICQSCRVDRISQRNHIESLARKKNMVWLKLMFICKGLVK